MSNSRFKNNRVAVRKTKLPGVRNNIRKKLNIESIYAYKSHSFVFILKIILFLFVFSIYKKATSCLMELLKISLQLTIQLYILYQNKLMVSVSKNNQEKMYKLDPINSSDFFDSLRSEVNNYDNFRIVK